jgi:hypothetical protein
MQIPFTAYAEDCTVTGEIALGADRLSDLLSSTTEYEIASPSFTALDDGRQVTAESCSVTRDDLCLVLATGPRGKVERRLWTRQHPVRARIGPYTVIGYLHAPPTIDPLRTTDRRPIVALTEGSVTYADGSGTVRIEAQTVLVNSAKIDVLETATSDDLGLANHGDLQTATDPRARDLTESW